MIKKVIILFCFLFSTHIFASEDKAFFWEVKSKTATVYLLGSIHYADKSFYPLRKEIEQAFNESDALAVEISMDEDSAVAYERIVAGKGSYVGNETIKDHISKETYTSLKQNLKQLGLPVEVIEKNKPGIVVLTLAAVKAMSLGLDPSLGIDLHFMVKAKEKKEIISLETVEEQLDIFLGVPNGDLMLKETLHSLDKAELVIGEMVDAWKRGDENKMHQLFFEDTVEEYPEFAAIFDRLIYQRNKKMTKKVQSYLKTNKTFFVVVGAGHFIGERGIVRLLEQAGYYAQRL